MWKRGNNALTVNTRLGNYKRADGGSKREDLEIEDKRATLEDRVSYRHNRLSHVVSETGALMLPKKQVKNYKEELLQVNTPEERSQIEGLTLIDKVINYGNG